MVLTLSCFKVLLIVFNALYSFLLSVSIPLLDSGEICVFWFSLECKVYSLSWVIILKVSCSTHLPCLLLELDPSSHLDPDSLVTSKSFPQPPQHRWALTISETLCHISHFCFCVVNLIAWNLIYEVSTPHLNQFTLT